MITAIVVFRHVACTVAHPVHGCLLRDFVGCTERSEEVPEAMCGNRLETWVRKLFLQRLQSQLAKVPAVSIRPQLSPLGAHKQKLCAVFKASPDNFAYNRMHWHGATVPAFC